MKSTEGKLLSTGYLQALEVGPDITTEEKKAKERKKIGLLLLRGAIDSIEETPRFAGFVSSPLIEIFVNFYWNNCLLF